MDINNGTCYDAPMTHIVYITENLVNRKTYIGVHTQDCDPYLFDGYLGSGDMIRRAIAKHGEHNFRRTTISHFMDRQEALDFERRLVTPEHCAKRSNYNMKRGGEGGSAFGRTLSLETRRRIGVKSVGRGKTQEGRRRISDGVSGARNGKAVAVIIDGRRFGSVVEARRTLGIGHSSMYRRLNSPRFPNYRWERDNG